MTDYLAGKNETQFGKGPDSSRISLFTAWGAGKGWNFVPLAPGILGVFLAYNLYQLLDGRFLLMGVVFLFFLLTGLVPRASVVSGLALALLAAALLLNGALDKFPPAEIKTTVIRKASVTGSQSRGTYYHVVVSSWRAGRSEEEFNVDLGIFRRAAVGRPATVELHKGYFGLPWYGNISPE